MKIRFNKYHGAGNDFVIIDNRNGDISLSAKQIAYVCHRRFGVGADGLMLLQSLQNADFQMVYYNSDGNTASMCGNGARCITAFARRLGIIGSETRFVAGDDMHTASVVAWDGSSGVVRVAMNVVENVTPCLDGFFVNTGVPHYVCQVQDVENFDVRTNGRKLRYNPAFGSQGANVDFIEHLNGKLYVRTYERGVEDETLSCGTGVTASALVWNALNHKTLDNVSVQTLGGDFVVDWKNDKSVERDVHLQGPATFVFDGEIDV